jgi:hypothetical protein
MTSAPGWIFFGTLVVLLACCSTSPTPAAAQTPGNNAVYGASGPTGSAAFIDASAVTQKSDICWTLYNIISATSPAYLPAVIDARGINSGLTCAAGNTPWQHGTSYATAPSVILLPAATITINTTWTVPANTRIVGEGASEGPYLTILQAASTFSGDMIDMGAGNTTFCGASSICQGVAVEHLQVNGAGNSHAVNGIVNSYSEDGSYVNDVALFNLGGIGLNILGTYAKNSGPYSNLTCDTGTSSAECVQIKGVSGTRGIRGLTCSGPSSYSLAAVLLDSSNNVIKDVRILGFYDGIRIGSQANAESNALFNILGDTNGRLAPPVNVVHIESVGNTVGDLSIMGLVNQGTNSNSIKDDATTTLLTDRTLAMYVLGKASSGGYSRFTTSPNAATWAVGTSAPTNPCMRGSLYSNTNATSSSYVLYVCTYVSGIPTWVGVE